jgi:serine/threonine-protein kinase
MLALAPGPTGQVMLVPGASIAAKYELDVCLGEGGMGTVWRARHVSLGHPVAIKLLQPMAHDLDSRARFEREARLAARLGDASRHIARVIDYGMLHGATPYLVMELLHGETLSARLKRQERLPLKLAAHLTLQLCRALQVAHLAGVVHRDVKPSNLFLCETEEAGEVLLKLMDFGVAKAARESDDDPTTRVGTQVGTPGYMSPEQIQCTEVDGRSDLWSVAACVYRMVTGQSPFGSGGMAELGLRILVTDPPRPTSVVPGLPRAFDVWIEKALSKNPERRFQSARDLADALAVVAEIAMNDENVALESLAPPPPQLDSDEASTSSSITPTEARRTAPEGLRRTHRQPRRGVVLAAIFLGAAAGGALAFGLGRGRRVATAETTRPAGEAVVAAPATSASAPRGEALASGNAAVALASAIPSSKPQTPIAASASSATPKAAAGPAPRPTSLREQSRILWKKKDEL